MGLRGDCFVMGFHFQLGKLFDMAFVSECLGVVRCVNLELSTGLMKCLSSKSSGNSVVC